MYWIGPHVSAAGGVSQAPAHAQALGATAFALFLKNQRQWQAAPLAEAEIAAFHAAMKVGGYTAEQVLPHAGYLINLANPDDEKQLVSFDSLLDEMTRCAALGLRYVNFHPGSHLRIITPQAACERTGQAINRAHQRIAEVVLVVENTAGSGGNIGSTFDELRIIRDTVEDKARLGFCLDTAHALASGHDIRTYDGLLSMIEAFDRAVGLQYLRAMHLNDSKVGLNAHVDRHESIGKGAVGIPAFEAIFSDARFENMPLILETPNPDIWAEEIQMLKNFSTKTRVRR